MVRIQLNAGHLAQVHGRHVNIGGHPVHIIIKHKPLKRQRPEEQARAEHRPAHGPPRALRGRLDLSQGAPHPRRQRRSHLRPQSRFLRSEHGGACIAKGPGCQRRRRQVPDGQVAQDAVDHAVGEEEDGHGVQGDREAADREKGL